MFAHQDSGDWSLNILIDEKDGSFKTVYSIYLYFWSFDYIAVSIRQLMFSRRICTNLWKTIVSKKKSRTNRWKTDATTYSLSTIPYKLLRYWVFVAFYKLLNCLVCLIWVLYRKSDLVICELLFWCLGSKTICDICMRKQSSEYFNCGIHKMCDICGQRFQSSGSCPLCGRSNQRSIEKVVVS